MKRIGILISFLMVTGLALAACTTPLANPAGTLVPETTVTAAVNQLETAVPAATVTAEVNQLNTAVPQVNSTTVASNLDLLNNLIGQSVKSVNGETIGQVTGVVVNVAKSAEFALPNVEYVTIAPAPSLGIGNNTLYVPASAFQAVNPSEQALTLKVDQNALAQAPNFAANNLPDVNTTNWDQQILSYWQNLGISVPVTGANTGAELSSSTVVINGKSYDLSVYGVNGQVIGQVKDFLIDPETGQIRYAILQGGSDFENKVIPIPMSVLNWSLNQNAQSLGQLTLNQANSILQNAPAFTNLNDINSTLNTLSSQVENYWKSLNK